MAFVAATVTGGIEAENLDGNVFATSVTGSVEISTLGLASATTVTGSITASIGLGDWDRDLESTTVTGSVTVEIPSNANADVTATAVNGTVTSTFPLSGTAQSMQGTIGNGGRNLTLTTVTGDITLRARA